MSSARSAAPAEGQRRRGCTRVSRTRRLRGSGVAATRHPRATRIQYRIGPKALCSRRSGARRPTGLPKTCAFPWCKPSPHNPPTPRVWACHVVILAWQALLFGRRKDATSEMKRGGGLVRNCDRQCVQGMGGGTSLTLYSSVDFPFFSFSSCFAVGAMLLSGTDS